MAAITPNHLVWIPAHVRLDRLNAGACLIDSHQDRSLAAVLGSVMPGTARIENGQGIARVRFAKTSDVADTVAKIIDGHIRSLSVGYNVHTYQRTETAGERPVMHAIDWEPVELSMVVVPFDAAAQVRSKGTTMPDIIETPTPTPSPRNRAGGVTVDYIRDRCNRSDDLPRSFERSLLEMHAEEPLSRRELDERIEAELIGRRSHSSIDPRQSRGGPGGDSRQLRDNFADALFARMSGTEPTEGAREYRDASVVDMARALLERNGEPVRLRQSPSRRQPGPPIRIAHGRRLRDADRQRWHARPCRSAPRLALAAAGDRAEPELHRLPYPLQS